MKLSGLARQGFTVHVYIMNVICRIPCTCVYYVCDLQGFIVPLYIMGVICWVLLYLILL